MSNPDEWLSRLDKQLSQRTEPGLQTHFFFFLSFFSFFLISLKKIPTWVLFYFLIVLISPIVCFIVLCHLHIVHFLFLLCVAAYSIILLALSTSIKKHFLLFL